MFRDTPQNVWQHSPKYNISPISRVPKAPFPFPVFMVCIPFNMFSKLIQTEIKYIKNKAKIIENYTVNIWKRQFICTHLLFALSNMDVAERNFVKSTIYIYKSNFVKKKETSEIIYIVLNLNEFYLLYLLL